MFYPNSEMEYAAQLHFLDSTKTKKLARLRSGFLIRDMLEHFTAKSESKLSPDYSFWMYSGHDTTIFALLNTLGVLDACLIHFNVSSFVSKVLFVNIFTDALTSLWSCRFI